MPRRCRPIIVDGKVVGSAQVQVGYCSSPGPRVRVGGLPHETAALKARLAKRLAAPRRKARQR